MPKDDQHAVGPGAQFDAQLQRALEARRGGNLVAAVEAFRVLCEIDPDHLGALCELAFTLLAAGELGEAETICLAVLEREARQPAALICLANLYRQRGDPSRALDYFQRSAAEVPDHVAVLADLASCLIELSRPSEAEPVLYDALAVDPGSTLALGRLAAAQRAMGKHSAALFHLRQIVREEPANFRAHLDVGLTLQALGRRTDAEKAIRAALELAPDQREPYRHLAEALRSGGRFAEAADVLERALERGCLDRDGLVQLSVSQREAGNPARADAVIEQLLALDPSNPFALMTLGTARRAAGDRAGALAAFQRAAHLDPMAALPDVAEAYLALGQIPDAIAALRRVITTDPENFRACLKLAELSRAGGKWTACFQLCDALMRRYPDRIEPVAERCRALIASDRRGEAMDLAGETREGGPPLEQVLKLRLEVARACLEPEFARAALGAAEKLARTDFEVWLGSAGLRLALGDAAGARAVLERPLPSGSPFDVGRVHELNAALASLEWRIGSAVEDYEAALAANPVNPDANFNLARLHLLRVDAEASASRLAIFLRQAATERTLRGQSTRPSQNLIGQLLNELKTDRALSRQLSDAVAEGPTAIDTLVELVARSPDSTPAAICLLLGLRTSGALTGDGDRADECDPPAIPRLITQYWPDDGPPPAVRIGFGVARDLHPHWRHVRYNLDSARAYLEAHATSDVRRACERARVTNQFDALFRLAALHAEGGFFIDASDQLIASLDDAAPSGATLCVLQDAFSALSAGFLGCAPGEPVIARALDLAAEAMNRGDNDIPWLATGPGLITRAFAQVLAEQGAGWPTWLKSRFVGDRVTFRDRLISGYVLGV